MRHIIIALLTFSLFCQCTKDGKELTENTITIDLDNQIPTSIFDIVDSISVVPLETNDSCLIASVDQIALKDDKLYILDARQGIFFCFNNAGKFLFRISNKGQGPDEYQYIESFDISNSGEIYLLEPWGNIYHFDSTGMFIEKVELPKDLTSYNEIYFNYPIITIISWQDALSYSLETKESKVHHLCKRINPFHYLHRSYTYKNATKLTTLFTNKTFDITPKGLIYSWQWDFKENNNSETQIEEIEKELTEPQTDNNKRIADYVGKGKHLNQYIYSNIESTRFKIAIMEYNNDFLHIFHDKKENKNYVFNRTKENTILYTTRYSNDAFLYCDMPFIEGWRDLTVINDKLIDMQKYEGSKYNEDNPRIAIFHLKK